MGNLNNNGVAFTYILLHSAKLRIQRIILITVLQKTVKTTRFLFFFS